ncbi:hypothetical protein U9M48_035012 [Paspalum notatum var. saurae]|uniref:Uncharacterized protein n=1 Tax=Paspalum notatum var. saurae TaxID=547442 RepID=A0AAQ3X7W8_PASNO
MRNTGKPSSPPCNAAAEKLVSLRLLAWRRVLSRPLAPPDQVVFKVAMMRTSISPSGLRVWGERPRREFHDTGRDEDQPRPPEHRVQVCNDP